MPKRTALTDEQIERRRSIDRTAQRNARAKTKARIRELEKLVDSLQTSQGDERLQNVMTMLEQQQEEARKLKSTLDAVRKLVGGEITLPEDPLPDAGSEREDVKGYGRPPSIGSEQTLNDTSMAIAASASMPSLERSSTSPSSFSLPDRTRQQLGFPKKLPTWQAVNNALEKAVLSLQQETQVSQASDTDIAIRAVLEGWTAARASRSLDLGWLILKQIDQHVFCDTSPATRMAILRAMRLNMLVDRLSQYRAWRQLLTTAQKSVNSRHADVVVPAFYNQRPSQRMIRHPVLVDFFVWPDLRDHILLSPSLYKPNAFAARFSKHVHFLWADSLPNLAHMDHFSGMYTYSQAFDNRFQDICCWTLGSDFFAHYPQLIGVVPIFNAMPPSLVLRIPTSSHAGSSHDMHGGDFGDGMDAEGNMSGFHTFGEGSSWTAQSNVFGLNQ